MIIYSSGLCLSTTIRSRTSQSRTGKNPQRAIKAGDKDEDEDEDEGTGDNRDGE